MRSLLPAGRNTGAVDMTLEPSIRLGLFFVLCASGVASAATPPTGFEGSPWQALFGLVVVLAVIAGAAWLLRRFTQVGGGGGGALSTVAVLAVGQKERIVLVQCRETWIVVGVAPGQVSALHTMARPQAAESVTLIPAGESSDTTDHLAGIPAFRNWLEKAMKRHAN